MEVCLRHSLSTIDAGGHLDAVEINLHNALLRPTMLNENGKIHLKALAQPGRRRPKKNVFRRLLTDGTCPSPTTAGTCLIDSFADGFKIEPLVLKKTLVLGCHHGKGKVGRHGLQIHPLMAPLPTQAVISLHRPNDHERGDAHRKPTIPQYRTNARHEKSKDEKQRDFKYTLHLMIPKQKRMKPSQG
ncbi:hypothetical protein EVA_03519 [gut metagenome]|uniref:Uncharacterized protein n=1 Tax=gut metagenome TaxID=749906 RepID=J9H3U9_9ZZZZ